MDAHASSAESIKAGLFATRRALQEIARVLPADDDEQRLYAQCFLHANEQEESKPTSSPTARCCCLLTLRAFLQDQRTMSRMISKSNTPFPWANPLQVLYRQLHAKYPAFFCGIHYRERLNRPN